MISSNIFNNYFVNITKSLNIPAWNPENSWNNTDLDKILETFESHPSFRDIKDVTSDTKFRYHGKRAKLLWNLIKNKATSGNILTKTLKTIARYICVALTDCINLAILNGVSPDELKLAGVATLYKKSDPEDKLPTDKRLIITIESLWKNII